jgi:hypothetical protein
MASKRSRDVRFGVRRRGARICRIWEKRGRGEGKNIRKQSEKDSRILESDVIDGMKSGRPKEMLKDKEEAPLAAVRNDHLGRGKSSKIPAYKQDISSSSASRILKAMD